MHTIKLLKHSKTPDWQFELANAITCVDELLQWLELEHLKDDLVQDPTFRLLAPRAFVKKIRKRDSGDPLLRQILPLAAENSASGFADPVGDIDAMKTPGLLHKYKGRALLVTTGACAIHCRYCFRRHFPYASANPRKNEWRAMIDYLECHDDIREIILSGGEPLILDNDRLEQLLGTIEQIEHLEWLRIHTRLPVVLPSRIDDGLLSLLQHLRFRTTLVVHSNHANELMTDEMDVLHKLARAGVTLLNQSVLLKGVNDSATALIALSQRLHEAGVLPYYLHMLDPVQGASHFDVPQHIAVELINTIKTELPGFLVPRLVRETPGAASKSAIFTI
ncbi:MAG: EF-P beta-lysylation protein EpmB [Thiotrichales bacterium]|nr:MAG: EF-P beta-lysylation protein EpmB [Thiotrichales bacterium]